MDDQVASDLGPHRAPSANARDGQGEGLVSFQVFGWNVGGVKLDGLKDIIFQVTGSKLLATDIFLVQEFPRRKQGWSSEIVDGLVQTSYRAPNEWRGRGVIFNSSSWAVLKKVPGPKGVWLKMKFLPANVSVWFGVFHFNPGCNLADYEDDLASFLNKKPKDSLPVVLQGDANAPLSWVQAGSRPDAIGLNHKATLLLDAWVRDGFHPCAPPEKQFRTPTSRPRQEAREGNQIDVFATKRVHRDRVCIHCDSCHLLGSDHELMQGTFSIRGKSSWKQHHSAPRIWKGGIDQITHVNQEVLQQLAKQCTKPKPGRSYRDPTEIKELFRKAKLSRSKDAWKAALKGRKQARQAWEASRLAQAAQGAGWLTGSSVGKALLPGTKVSLKHKAKILMM